MTPEEHAALDHALQDLQRHIRHLAGNKKVIELTKIVKALRPIFSTMQTASAKRFMATFFLAGGGK